MFSARSEKPWPGEDAVQPPGDDGQQQARRQFAGPRHQPFAGLVALADHGVRLVARPVVEIFLELALDDAALFLDDEDLLLLLDEIQRVAPRQRPHHADLVDVDAEFAALLFADAEQAQRLHQVEMRLAGGDDAEAGVPDVVDVAVDRIGLGEGEDGVLLRLHPLLDLRAGQVRPAVMQPARRRREIGRPEVSVCRKVDRGRRFHRFRDRLETDPHARKARQGVAVFGELQIFGDAGRVQRRHEPGHERDVRLVRHRGGDAAVIVAGDDEDAAMRRRAVGIAVLERVAGTVDARPLAVPEPEDALDLAVRIGLDLLRSQNGGRGEVLVDRRQELDAEIRCQVAGPPHLQIERAERRAAIAGNEPGGLQPGCAVAARLVERGADKCLRAGQENTAVFLCVAIRKRIGRERDYVGDVLVHRDILPKGGFHSDFTRCGRENLPEWPFQS